MPTKGFIPGADFGGSNLAIQGQRVAALEAGAATLAAGVSQAESDAQSALTRVAVLESVHQDDEIDAKFDGGFVGNGTSNDTENLINICRTGFLRGQPVFIPSGIFYIKKPLTLASETVLRGNKSIWSRHGTILRPTADFETTYNPNGVKASMIQCQMDADPSGQGRWFAFLGNPWFGGKIENISLENSPDGVFDAFNLPVNPVTNLNGVSINYAAENTVFNDLYCAGFETSYWVAGLSSGLTMHRCSTWGAKHEGFLLGKHPTLGGGNGPVRLYAPSGDYNATAFFRVRGTYQLLADFPKFESPINLTDSIVVVDTPEPIDVGQQIYPYIELRGSNSSLNGGTGSHAITNLVKIQKTGTSNPAEYPLPAIRICGGYYYAITNDISDDTTGVTIPTVQNGQGTPRLEVLYCASTSEQIVRYTRGGHQFLGSPIILYPFAFANRPAAFGMINAFGICTDARRAGQGPGAGTGCPVWTPDGTNWLNVYDNNPVQV